MALEKVGLGAVLTSDTKQYVNSTKRARDANGRFVSSAKQYTDSMGRARDANGRFVAGANKVPPPLGRIGAAATRVAARIRAMATGVARGGRMIGSGLRDMGLGLAPLSLGLGVAVMQAAAFEKKMSGVGAVSRANQEDMAALSKEARRMGIVSVFSASQAAEGMENMARAGAKPTEIIAGLGGVMNAAAADGISLAQSSDIVAKITKGMGLEWSEASHIADNLALASASSNTNILALGESFIYGVSTSKQMGVSLEQTTAIFSKLADAGLRGSLGGTAYANMMTKLAKPTSKGGKILKQWNIKLEDSHGKLRKVASIVADFTKKLSKIKSVTERQAIAQEVFGRRGARAYAALATAGEKATLELEESLVNSSKDGGAALEMANRRLDNFAGSLTLLKSSLEGLSIGLFQPLLKPFATSIRQFTGGFNNVLMALNDINDFWDENPEAMSMPIGSLKKYGDTASQIALGLRDTINAVGEAWDWVTDKIKAAGSWFEKTFGSSGSIRSIVKIGSLILMAAAALAPLILGLVMAKFVIGGLITALAGVGVVIAAIFWPALVAVGAVILAYQMLKRENESFLQTASRVWGEFKTWVLDVWENGLKPLWRGFKEAMIPVIEELGVIWGEVITNVKLVFADLYEFIFGGLEGTKISWKEVGRVIGAIIGALATVILVFVKYAIPLIASIAKAVYAVFKTVWDVVSWFITQIAEGFAKLAIGIGEIFSGNIIQGLKRIGLAILDLMLKPLRLVLEGALALGDLLDIDVPDWVRTLAKEGITGLVFDVPAKETEKVFKTRTEMMASLGIVKPEELVKPGEPLGGRLGEVKTVEGEKLKAQRLEDQMLRDIVNRREAAGADLNPASIAKELAAMMAKKEGAAQTPIDVTVENLLEDKRELEIKNNLCVSGEDVSIASGRHKVELQERAGFKSTPWQKRAILEHGAAPVSRG